MGWEGAALVVVGDEGDRFLIDEGADGIAQGAFLGAEEVVETRVIGGGGHGPLRIEPADGEGFGDALHGQIHGGVPEWLLG